MNVHLYSFTDLIKKAPISSSEILELLNNHESLTLGQIKRLLPYIEIKIIKSAVCYLKTQRIIIGKHNLSDLRSVTYRLTTQDEYFEGLQGVNYTS